MDISSLILPTIIAVIFVVFLIHGVHESFSRDRRRAAMLSQNFDWYRKSYPSSFRNGAVHCHVCGSNRIAVRSLMQQAYMRVHLCSQCGAELYFSPERS